MNDYKLESWINYVYEKYGKDYASAFAELTSPDPTIMVMHYLKQSQRAVRFDQQNEEAEPDPRWESLGNMAAEALGAIETDDTQKIAFAFYNLGKSAESLSHPSQDKQLTYQAAYIEKLRSEFPLTVSNAKRDFLIEAIQAEALKRWATDSDKDFRLTEMCVLLLSDAQDTARQIGTEVPTKANTLKPWLRKVAPEHAKKPGKPKKTDVIMQSER
jgi:hypothetical protein